MGAPARLDYDGPVATITLDRPERFNALDRDAALALFAIGQELAERRDVRVIVIRGAGRSFCAGGDIETFAAHIDATGPMVTGILEPTHAFLTTLRTHPAVVVTSVQGAAAGGGLSLAFMGDLCVAADTARFTPAYIRLGVSPDAGGTVGLARIVGARRAMQIFLMEDGFSAAQAESWGLVNKVVPEAELAAETAALAKRLAGFSPAAVAATKRLIHGTAGRSMAEQLDAELNELIGCMETEAFREAVHRFLAKAGKTGGRA
ncbi:enoyl-CoA hydratase/isomerase family protein [Phreatobacter sp. AB_2022a]|uniref:enoyl-CoA hydratase/isomerase family protein n=1 Tax=Phreatobacter sp. AB_2022a TaxID=3003134 RepID=UPI0022875580|nr:enoyl-CoA hydratase-related protein [Phreatobacter sp. AB_2022a]MCZ0732851.1 enoyl-CoA hydratase-related protein [Phreatobacter sp. AB_2022a]